MTKFQKERRGSRLSPDAFIRGEIFHDRLPFPRDPGKPRHAEGFCGFVRLLRLVFQDGDPTRHLLLPFLGGDVDAVVHRENTQASQHALELVVGFLQKGGDPRHVPLQGLGHLELALVKTVVGHDRPGVLEERPHLDLGLPLADLPGQVDTQQFFRADLHDVVHRQVPEFPGLEAGLRVLAVRLVDAEVLPDEPADAVGFLLGRGDHPRPAEVREVVDGIGVLFGFPDDLLREAGEGFRPHLNDGVRRAGRARFLEHAAKGIGVRLVDGIFLPVQTHLLL